MKFLSKYTVCYTFVVMATNSDVTMTSSVVKRSDFKKGKKIQDNFWLFC